MLCIRFKSSVVEDLTSLLVKTFLKLHMSSREIIKNEKLAIYLHSRNSHFRPEGGLMPKKLYETYL